MDIAIIETGNGGDIQVVGNDLGVVKGIENMPYLGMCGGNIEAVTTNNVPAQSFDWWANALFSLGLPSIQLNSIFEKTLNDTELTSQGRVRIENAIKQDLKFLSDLATITVDVKIVATDRIKITLTIMQDDLTEKIVVINFKKTAVGDFWIFDFNDDFFV